MHCKQKPGQTEEVYGYVLHIRTVIKYFLFAVFSKCAHFNMGT
jgi:hypothetical protein